jgi:hypothetical protein
LIDHFGVDSSFLIISAILLNLIACGLVIRPVPIEPAEKEKRMKKIKNSPQKNKRPLKEIDTKLSEENEKMPLEMNKITIVVGEENNKTNFDQNNDEITIEKIKEEPHNTGSTEKKKSFKEIVQSFIDFSLFYDLIFMYFAASNFLTNLGFNAPYIFIVDQAISLGVEKHKADILLSTIGDAFFINHISYLDFHCSFYFE